MIHYNPTVSGSLVVTGSLITTGNINGINLSTFSASINNALTESKVTHIVSQSGGLYYIDGVQKPSMSFVPGITYRFDTTIPDDPMHQHPFKFSTSPNGPTQYVDGVTSGSNYIQIETSYNTPELLYYYCTVHNGMGNAINVLKIDKLLTTVSSSFDSRYVISGSITQTTWDNIASKPSGIVSSSVQVLGGTNIVSGSSQLTASALATTGSNTFIGNQNISGTLYLTGSLIPSGNFVYDLGSETNSFGDLFISTGSIRFHNPDGTEQGRITVDAKSGDISLLKTAGLTNEQKATIRQGNINPNFLSAVSASNLFVQNNIVLPAWGTVHGINLTAFSSSVSNTILNQNAATSSYETKGRGIISGSSQLDGTTITNLTVTNLTTVNETASVIFSSGSNRFGDFGDDIHDFTGSVQVTGSFTLVGSSTATSYSGIINATNGVVSGSSQVVSILSSLNTYTGSQDTKNSTLATYTSSVDTKFTSVGISTASLNTYTSSLKTALQLTGSNVVVSGDLTVLGTTNTANSTTLNISDKFITLASGSTSSAIANGAGFRIAGANVTMSWESANSQLKFNTDISASKFYGDGTGLIFNGSGIVSSSVQTIANLPTGTVSGSSQVVGILSSLNTYTGSNDTTNTAQNARLTTIESVTGSYETKGSGIVSGSSQITYTGISSIPSGIVSGSSQTIANLPTGTVSGSSQINVMSTTNIARLATTGSNTFIGNQTITGSLLVSGSSATFRNVISTSNSNIQVGNDTSSNGGGIALFGSGFTPSNQYRANGAYFYSNLAGGLTLHAEGVNSMYLATNNTTAATISSAQVVNFANLPTVASSNMRTDTNTSYSTTFTSVSSVSVTHNLGTKNVMVMCYGSDDEMFWPATIKTTSTTVVDITFTTSRSGRVVIIR